GRPLHHQQLVGADAEAPVGQPAPLRRSEIQGLARGVDHDEVVAGAVHLGEFELHAAIISVQDGSRSYTPGAPGGRVLKRLWAQKYSAGCSSTRCSIQRFMRALACTGSSPGKSSRGG